MLIHDDCLNWTRSQPDDSVDLVFGSPPYENRRSYGIGFNLKGEKWVQWALERFVDQVRICRGLVCWVVDGPTAKFRWSATPALLMADLHRAGIKLRKPPIFHRVGIPGSGGPDWLRNDYEFIVCASKGRLPWSDNTAMGGAPKYGVGGDLSHHGRNGRVKRKFKQPKRVNPGNIVKCVVGGNKMGHQGAHKNEASFPESLCEYFIRSFCAPGATVYDPFAGSGTTGAVAARFGRDFIGTEIRKEQIALATERLALVQHSAA